MTRHPYDSVNVCCLMEADAPVHDVSEAAQELLVSAMAATSVKSWERDKENADLRSQLSQATAMVAAMREALMQLTWVGPTGPCCDLSRRGHRDGCPGKIRDAALSSSLEVSREHDESVRREALAPLEDLIRRTTFSELEMEGMSESEKRDYTEALVELDRIGNQLRSRPSGEKK